MPHGNNFADWPPRIVMFHKGYFPQRPGSVGELLLNRDDGRCSYSKHRVLREILKRASQNAPGIGDYLWWCEILESAVAHVPQVDLDHVLAVWDGRK